MKENEEIINRLSQNPPEDPHALDQDEGEVIPVKVRENVMESIKRASAAAKDAESNRDVVDEYEDRYQQSYDAMEDASKKSKRGYEIKVAFPPSHRRAPRPTSSDLEENEKMWAAMAHGSALVTVGLGIATGGVASLLTLFIPLAIYLSFRQKSEYVARHALQAFAAQVVGVVGFIILSVTVLTLWIVLLLISALLVLVLIGILLLPVVAIVGVIALAATLILPFGMLVYSMIAAVESLNGHNYSYPWIGDWVDDQLYGGIEEI